MDKIALANEFYKHLTKDLIPFWTELRDEENGGFYGLVDFDHKLDKKADKGCILNSRILWFFSTAKLLFEQMAKDNGDVSEHRKYADQCMKQAEHAYKFFSEAFLFSEPVFFSATVFFSEAVLVVSDVSSDRASSTFP